MTRFYKAITLGILLGAGAAVSLAAAPATTQSSEIGERIPSEDDRIKNFHSMGLIDGRTDIFRSACPVRDLAKHMETTQPSEDDVHQAEQRMRHLYDLGIRTIVSFQSPSGGDESKGREVVAAVNLERFAAEASGIHYRSDPLANSGPGSIQSMSDQQAFDVIEPIAAEIVKDSASGGILFHCSAGHDRTGMVAAFIRMKYQQWPVDQAIAEMRRLGHNWPKYSSNGGVSSWHEDHLRAFADLLKPKSDQ